MVAISTVYFNFSSGHQGTSSRGFIKAQGQVSKSQIPMTPSSNQWLFSLTVFLQWNTGSSFSRDIQEAVQNDLSRGQCSINPPWQAHPFQYSLHSPRPVFQSYIMGKSFNTVHFPIWKGVHSIRQSIQLSVFNTGPLSA
ncbi:hypothetical protein O181_082909 [Austropuccinia psidii MF-1]|uniref:Uncharacterized protein n=1 Tax=Austropuccinia psidii MF-1 TaxID=1389203 RepID=A0A9Q3FQ75_9BASI|nr:hypothetical protein [Austropuccinia psidii MF-1]